MNAAIYSEYYQDESVLLRDLLFPELSDLYRTEKFKHRKAEPGVFKKRFTEVLFSGDYPNLKKAMGLTQMGIDARTQTDALPYDTTMQIYSKSNGVLIYFPYSENFGNIFTPSYFDNINSGPRSHLATVVAADRDADSAPGREPYVCGTRTNQRICYINVTIDDTYAKSAETHIVGVASEYGKILPPVPPVVPPSTASRVVDTVIIPTGTIDTVREVFVGQAMLKRHYDRLVSFTGNGGGSEIVFCRASGYLQNDADDQVNQNQAFDRVAVNFKRSDIEGAFTIFQTGLPGILFNDPRWKKINILWDNNWRPNNFEQVFAIYEEDNRSSITTTGTINTTLDSLGIPVKGTLGFTFTRKSQDDWLRQNKLSHIGFLAYTLSPAVCKTRENYPIWDCEANISFTMPYRVVIFR